MTFFGALGCHHQRKRIACVFPSLHPPLRGQRAGGESKTNPLSAGGSRTAKHGSADAWQGVCSPQQDAGTVVN